MSQVAAILSKLPPYQGNERLLTRRQDTFDIITEIMRMHGKAAPMYDRIAMQHWQGDEQGTARHLFDFMKKHVPYTVEDSLAQTVKKPQAILAERLTFGNDCKHYASYIVGVGAALNRLGFPIKCFYRFGSYKNKISGKASRAPGHVFAVFVINGREIWIDPVPEIGGYNNRSLSPVYVIDKMPPMRDHTSIGSLYEISGVGDRQMQRQRDPMGQQPRQMTARLIPLNKNAGGLQRQQGLRPKPATHWLDDMQPHQVGKAGKGKAKVQKFIKSIRPGQAIKKAAQDVKKGAQNTVKAVKKIQPGKAIKKVARAPARNAYLLLVKGNVFKMAVKIRLAEKKNKNFWPALKAKWESLGGDSNKLRTAVSQGLNLYNKLHPKAKVSGIDMYAMGGGFNFDLVAGISDPEDISGMEDYVWSDSVGVAAPAAAAIIAAAAPIIQALTGIFKAFGVRQDDTDSGMANADNAAADDHNNATSIPNDGNKDITLDGSVDHGNGVTTTATTDGQGNQVVKYDVADPDLVKGKSKDKYTEMVDTDGDGITDTQVTTKHKETAKDISDGSSFQEMWNNVTEFVTEHKWKIIGVISVVGGVILIKKLATPKGRRR